MVEANVRLSTCDLIIHLLALCVWGVCNQAFHLHCILKMKMGEFSYITNGLSHVSSGEIYSLKDESICFLFLKRRDRIIQWIIWLSKSIMQNKKLFISFFLWRFNFFVMFFLQNYLFVCCNVILSFMRCKFL